MKDPVSARPRPSYRGPVLAAGGGLLGSTGARMISPRLGMELTAVGVGMTLVVLLTVLAILLIALFGSKQHSSRAFRLLRWLRPR